MIRLLREIRAPTLFISDFEKFLPESFLTGAPGRGIIYKPLMSHFGFVNHFELK